MPVELIRRNFRQYDRDQGETGILAPSCPGYSRSNLTLVANQAQIGRFVPSRPMSIALISFAVSTAAGSDDACDVGIYNSALTTKIASAGATTGKLNGTGVKTIAVVASLQAGTVYYAALSCGAIGTTAAIIGGGAFTVANYGALFGAGAPNQDAMFLAASHPLPASLAGASGTSTAPLLGIRES